MLLNWDLEALARAETMAAPSVPMSRSWLMTSAPAPRDAILLRFASQLAFAETALLNVFCQSESEKVFLYRDSAVRALSVAVARERRALATLFSALTSWAWVWRCRRTWLRRASAERSVPTALARALNALL